MDPFPPTPAPRKRRRFLRFLIKAPLGCLAFIVGATVIGVLFLPWAVGKVVGDELEADFNDTFQGHLHLGQTWLPSFYGDQWMDDVQLHDPDGDLVLEGGLRAPNLVTLFDEHRRLREPWGPVELVVERLFLHQDQTGTTNLARALSPRPGRKAVAWHIAPQARPGVIKIRSGGNHLEIPDPEGLRLTVVVRRATWSNPTLRRRGHAVEVEDVVLTGTLRHGAPGLSVSLEGVAHLPPSGGDTGDRGELEIALDMEGLAAGPEVGTTWTCTVGGGGVPTEELDLLLGTTDTVAAAFGPRLHQVDIDLARDGDGALHWRRLLLSSPQARLSLTDGVLRSDGAIEAGPEGVLAVEFPVDSWWTAEALRPFLPLCGALDAIDTSRPARFQLDDFVLVDRTGFLGSSGRARIELPTTRWSFPSTLGEALDAAHRGLFRADAISVSSRLEGDRVLFENQELFADKLPLPFHGQCNLSTGELDLRLVWPASWPAMPAASADGAVEVAGPLTAPRFVPREN